MRKTGVRVCPGIEPVMLLLIGLLSGCQLSRDAAMTTTDDRVTYQQLLAAEWQEVFYDPCTNDWTTQWMLDGARASVENAPEGMVLTAGPVQGDDACHAVLWTRQVFRGDLRIDYEYTKLDDEVRNVNIIYLLASGSGADGYDFDIEVWSSLRRIPSMSLYFNHMNAYHISYAAFDQDNEDPGNDYIRARRYLPETGRGLDGTDLPPEYLHTGLFEQGVPHRITTILKGNDLFMHIRNSRDTLLCHWKTDGFPPMNAGRIGLRHMFTRSARYRNFRVAVLRTGGDLQADLEHGSCRLTGTAP